MSPCVLMAFSTNFGLLMRSSKSKMVCELWVSFLSQNCKTLNTVNDIMDDFPHVVVIQLQLVCKCEQKDLLFHRKVMSCWIEFGKCSFLKWWNPPPIFIPAGGEVLFCVLFKLCPLISRCHMWAHEWAAPGCGLFKCGSLWSWRLQGTSGSWDLRNAVVSGV